MICKTTALSSASIIVALACPAAFYASAAQAQTPLETGGAASDEIVVTAQRRAEKVQQVTISMTAIDSKLIKKLDLKTLADLEIATPGVTFGRGLGFQQTYIRGIGSQLANPGLEAPVATYVDGAYLQRQYGTVYELLDSSASVLRGPQGALYGRNASGGVILINSNEPTDSFEGYVSGEYGRFNQHQLESVINAPMSKDVAVRVAGRYAGSDGYVKNIYDGGEGYTRRVYDIRGSISFKPSNDFSALLRAEYSDAKERSTPGREFLPAPLCAFCGSDPNFPIRDFYKVDINKNTPTNTSSGSVNLRLRYNTGVIGLESITSYRDIRVDGSQDVDMTPVSVFVTRQSGSTKTWTQDLQMTADRILPWLDGLFGVSYVKDESVRIGTYTGGLFDAVAVTYGAYPRTVSTVDTQSIGLYGELVVRPTERLRITLGGRYAHDRRKMNTVNDDAVYALFARGVGPQQLKQSLTFNNFTPRVVVAYSFDTVNLYASYNRGFVAGGWRTSATKLPAPSVKPEHISSYEIGAKFVSRDRRLRVNIAGFHYVHKDLQVTIFDVSRGGSITVNAAKSRAYGVELDGSYRVSEWLDLLGGGSYLDAKYTSFPAAAVVVVNPAGGLSNGFEDLSGFPLVRAPKYTAFLGANVNVPVSNGLKANFSAIGRYTSSFDMSPGAGGPLRTDHRGAYEIINISGGIGPIDDQWEVGFYVRNLTNRKYSLTSLTLAPYGASDFAAPPRTYGLRMRYKF